MASRRSNNTSIITSTRTERDSAPAHEFDHATQSLQLSSFRSRFLRVHGGPFPQELKKNVCLVDVSPLHICRSAVFPLPLPPVMFFNGVSTEQTDYIYGPLKYDHEIADLRSIQPQAFNPLSIQPTVNRSKYGKACFLFCLMEDPTVVTLDQYIASFPSLYGTFVSKHTTFF